MRDRAQSTSALELRRVTEAVCGAGGDQILATLSQMGTTYRLVKSLKQGHLLARDELGTLVALRARQQEVRLRAE